MNEVALRGNFGAPTEHEMMVFQTMSKSAVDSKMYKGIGDQAGLMMIMLAARELGIPPCQALNGGLNIISGKVEISARMMSALIRKAGHQIQVKDSTDTACTLIGRRCDTGETLTTSFTVSDAQKAGLVKPGGGWVKFPKDMCFARALSRLARQLFSDVIGIGYVEGEIVPTQAEIVMPEDVFPAEEITPENEQEITQDFLNRFEKQDQFLAMEYMRVVGSHFKWSHIQTIKELLKDEKRLFDKFNAWKDKQKIAEE